MTAEGDAASIARALAHDVGKYVARAARNLPAEGAIPRVLVDMMLRDLHAALPSCPTPRARFDALARELATLGVTDARLDQVRSALDDLAARRDAIATGDPAELRRAAKDALAIEQALASLARDLGSTRR